MEELISWADLAISAAASACREDCALGLAAAPVSVGSHVEYILLNYVFDELKFRKLCGEILSFNQDVVENAPPFRFCAGGVVSETHLETRCVQRRRLHHDTEGRVGGSASASRTKVEGKGRSLGQES